MILPCYKSFSYVTPSVDRCVYFESYFTCREHGAKNDNAVGDNLTQILSLMEMNNSDDLQM